MRDMHSLILITDSRDQWAPIIDCKAVVVVSKQRHWLLDHWMSWKGEVKMKWSRRKAKVGKATDGNEGWGRRNWSRAAERQIVRAPPRIELPGGVPPTCPPGPDPWDVWGSWRGEPPCGRRHGNRGMQGRRPGLRNDCKTGASSSLRIGAGRRHLGKTGAAVVRLGLLEGDGIMALSTLLGAWDWTISSHMRLRRRSLARVYVPSSRSPPKMRGEALGSSPITRRPLRARRYEAWRVVLRGGGGRWRWDDWGRMGWQLGGRWHRSAVTQF